MSYDIDLIDPKDNSIVRVDRHSEGGTYVLGGTDYAEINITYNYNRYFADTIDPDLGIRWLYGKDAKNTIDRLESSVKELGVERDIDYWKPTPGNAGYALSILLEWAKQHPKAVWRGD